MKKIKFALAVAATAFALGGCISYHTPPEDRRVTVAPRLSDAVWVTDIRMAKGPSSNYVLQANLVNNTSRAVKLEYCIIWLDSRGLEIPSIVSGWQFASLAPREVLGLAGVAPTEDACDFRLYVQDARPALR